MTDPIRTWLDVSIPDKATDIDYYGAEQMRDALFAVLDLCDVADTRLGVVRSDALRHVVADALGVPRMTDPQRGEGGAP